MTEEKRQLIRDKITEVINDLDYNKESMIKNIGRLIFIRDELI